MFAPNAPKRRLTVAYGVLLAILLAQVPLLLSLSGTRSARSSVQPGLPAGRLIGRGPADSPQLIATPAGLVGWWLTGTGTRRRLAIGLFDNNRLVRRRSVALSALTGPGGTIKDTPALALGPGGRLLITWRSVSARAHAAALGIGMWNTQLTGRPSLRLAGSVPLVSTSRANDLGPDEQYLDFDAGTHRYLLVEEDVRPWMDPNSTTPNRPEILVSEIDADGRLVRTNALGLPAAGSFIGPTVRVLPAPDGYQLIVTTHSVGPDTVSGPDQVWLYPVNRGDQQSGPQVYLYSAQPLDQILDSAAAAGPHGTRLLVLEVADPEQNGAQFKQLIGLAFDGYGPTGAPFVISQAVDPGAQLPAQPLLYRTSRPGQFLLVWNEGTAGLFATVTLTGGPVRLRPLFTVAHRLFMQPAAGMTYDAVSGQLEALWQDPGSAAAPQDIAAQAPLYLSAVPVN
jgi:hypothetical protein